jgi:hypothetical protein
MITLELTLASSTEIKHPLLLVLNGNFAVHRNFPVRDKPAKGAIIDDGVHNNGGWTVNESYEEVLEMIDTYERTHPR